MNKYANIPHTRAQNAEAPAVRPVLPYKERGYSMKKLQFQISMSRAAKRYVRA